MFTIYLTALHLLHHCHAAMCWQCTKCSADSHSLFTGLGLPHRELFSDAVDLQSIIPSNHTVNKVVLDSSSRSSIGNTTTTGSSSGGLTVSGLKEELSNLEDKVNDVEQRHRKGHLVAAATIGSLLLLIAVGCAGMLVYRRFVNSQHARKRSKADRLPYYDEDRLLGDAAGV